MGNLVTQQVGSVRSDVFSYAGTTPKLTTVSGLGGSESVMYDAVGNEVVVGGTAYTYSPRNSRSGAGVIEYDYDGRGVRVSTNVTGAGIDGWPAGSTRHSLYLPELSLMAETAITAGGPPAIEWEYIWFAGAPLAQIHVPTGAIDTS